VDGPSSKGGYPGVTTKNVACVAETYPTFTYNPPFRVGAELSTFLQTA